jgi:hypothetical protein
MKNIIIRCSIYSCYWNIGREFRRGGNCCSHKTTVNIDESLCAQYIERGEAQAKLAQAAFTKVGSGLDFS